VYHTINVETHDMERNVKAYCGCCFPITSSSVSVKLRNNSVVLPVSPLWIRKTKLMHASVQLKWLFLQVQEWNAARAVLRRETSGCFAVPLMIAVPWMFRACGCWVHLGTVSGFWTKSKTCLLCTSRTPPSVTLAVLTASEQQNASDVLKTLSLIDSVVKGSGKKAA
jgi:hypothetical protein